jgi:hypothetical protein
MVPSNNVLKGKQVKQEEKETSNKIKRSDNQKKNGVYNNNMESR